jgi:hypothetical protein
MNITRNKYRWKSVKEKEEETEQTKTDGKNRRKLGKEKVRRHTNRYRRKTITEIEMVDKEGRRKNWEREKQTNREEIWK